MYWKNNPASNWDSIFDREDLCLNDLMREQNLLEELKGQNRKLIDFLTKPDVALELVRLVTQEPENSVQPETRFVLPNMACEILTSDVQPMYNVLSHEEEIWKCFFNFLEDNEPPLNPLMASYFSRTLCSLILKTGSQDWYTYQFNCLKTLEKMSDRGNFIDLLLKHLDTTAIMDLIIKISTLLEGPPLRNNIFSLFEKEQLVYKLVDTFDPLSSPIRQLNAAEIICAIEIASEMHPLEQNPLVNTIESPEIVNKLLVKMFGQSEKTESTLLGGISILQTLLMCTKIKDDDSNEVYTKKQTMAEILCITILPFLEHIHNVLLFPPKIASLQCMGYVVEKLFGNVRLQIVKLICSLLSMHHQQINERFAQLNTVKVLIECFFNYDLNNFLHTQVVQCFHEIMCYNHSLSENSTFIAHVIKDCKLIEFILEHEKCIQPGKKRKGYIGHLVAIAKSLHNTETFYSDHFRGIIVNTLDADIVEKWDLFTSTTLKENEDRVSSCLGGLHPRDEIAIMDARKENEDDGRQDIVFTSNDNQLGISRVDINFDDEDDDDEGDENDKNTMESQAEMFSRMCSVRSSEMAIDDTGFKGTIISSTFDMDDNEMWKNDEDDSAINNLNINIFQNSFDKSDEFLTKENDLYWSPETSDWETFRTQLNAKQSSELHISDNLENNCACPSSPWGENIIEPKLETGWANFESSFGEPIELNGESGIDQELFAHLTDDNAQDPPFNSFPNKTYPTDSFSISQNKCPDSEVVTNINNKSVTTYSLISSEDLPKSIEIVANPLNNSNELPKESDTINNISDIKSFTKIHDMEPVDR